MPARPDPDADLIDALRRGEGDAWEEIVRRYARKVTGLCIRTVNDRSLADDLSQEAFLRAFRAIDRFDGRAAFGTWLYRIAMNLCLTELRSRRRRGDLQGDLASGGRSGMTGHDPGEPAPGLGVESDEAKREVLSAMADLSDEHRAILILRDIRGLDYGAIAEVLEIAPGTVKSRLFRARAALREILGHDELDA